MKIMNHVKGFKVFNPDWTCNPGGNTKQYSCPGKFEEDIAPVRCGEGMHFCKNASDCFNYYKFDPKNRVAEVVAYGDIAEEGDKCCTNKLEIVREIPWGELLEIVNTGKGCSGLCNSGNWNSGNWNSGDCNSGNRNSGDCNSGDWNSGNCNSGGWNSGNWNSGNCNSGDWNSCDFSNGCFNTFEPKIFLFNKLSTWSYSDWINSKARYILNRIPGNVLEYVYFENMTTDEKATHPEAEVTGGYLKKLNRSECRKTWWDYLPDDKKNIIKSIPNFNKEIFKEITGIDVG